MRNDRKNYENLNLGIILVIAFRVFKNLICQIKLEKNRRLVFFRISTFLTGDFDVQKLFMSFNYVLWF